MGVSQTRKYQSRKRIRHRHRHQRRLKHGFPPRYFERMIRIQGGGDLISSNHHDECWSPLTPTNFQFHPNVSEKDLLLDLHYIVPPVGSATKDRGGNNIIIRTKGIRQCQTTHEVIYRRGIYATDSDEIERYRQEMRILARLSETDLVPKLYMAGTVRVFDDPDDGMKPTLYTFSVMEKMDMDVSMYFKLYPHQEFYEIALYSLMALCFRLGMEGYCNTDVKSSNAVVRDLGASIGHLTSRFHFYLIDLDPFFTIRIQDFRKVLDLHHEEYLHIERDPMHYALTHPNVNMEAMTTPLLISRHTETSIIQDGFARMMSYILLHNIRFSKRVPKEILDRYMDKHVIHAKLNPVENALDYQAFYTLYDVYVLRNGPKPEWSPEPLVYDYTTHDYTRKYNNVLDCGIRQVFLNYGIPPPPAPEPANTAMVVDNTPVSIGTSLRSHSRSRKRPRIYSP